MKTIALVFGLVLLILAACPSFGQSAYLYSKQNDREEFMSAFAQETACHGIVLISDPSDTKSMSGFYRVHYFGAVGGSGIYAGYVVNPRTGLDVDFSGKTFRAAVRHACFIIKGKGGKVKGTPQS